MQFCPKSTLFLTFIQCLWYLESLTLSAGSLVTRHSQSLPYSLNRSSHSVYYHLNLVDMKFITVTFVVLLCCHRSLGTLVVDLNESSNENKNTFLALGQGIKINNPLTFCLRFNIKSALETSYIFSSTDDKFDGNVC